ncbi:MAG: hypothetical protein H6512_07690 [Acidimicrobiia bacterium]|nr:hypothetical protein [Acidimicrobiia bacterium]
MTIFSGGEYSLVEARDRAPQGGGKWLLVGNALTCTLGYVVIDRSGNPFGMSAATALGNLGVTLGPASKI